MLTMQPNQANQRALQWISGPKQKGPEPEFGPKAYYLR